MTEIERQRLVSIKENFEIAKKLGLPVNPRKFDRHVPRKDPAFQIIEEDQDEEEDEDEEGDNDSDISEELTEITAERELLNDEEVYLVVNNLEVFKAKYSKTDSSSTVHGKYTS